MIQLTDQHTDISPTELLWRIFQVWFIQVLIHTQASLSIRADSCYKNLRAAGKLFLFRHTDLLSFSQRMVLTSVQAILHHLARPLPIYSPPPTCIFLSKGIFWCVTTPLPAVVQWPFKESQMVSHKLPLAIWINCKNVSSVATCSTSFASNFSAHSCHFQCICLLSTGQT